MVENLPIVGAGRVGHALGRRLREWGWKAGVVCARSEASAQKAVWFIAAGRRQAGLTVQALTSRVVLLTMPDDAIPAVNRRRVVRADRVARRRSVAFYDALAAEIVRCRGGSMDPLQSI